MYYNKYANSWFPAKNFTKSSIGKDWMIGPGKCSTYKDGLYGTPIKKYETVLWNRSLNNMSISLENYYKAVKSNDETLLAKLKDIELPLDIKL